MEPSVRLTRSCSSGRRWTSRISSIAWRDTAQAGSSSIPGRIETAGLRRTFWRVNSSGFSDAKPLAGDSGRPRATGRTDLLVLVEHLLRGPVPAVPSRLFAAARDQFLAKLRVHEHFDNAAGNVED